MEEGELRPVSGAVDSVFEIFAARSAAGIACKEAEHKDAEKKKTTE